MIISNYNFKKFNFLALDWFYETEFFLLQFNYKLHIIFNFVTSTYVLQMYYTYTHII